ncbi:MAG: hypothetical protein FWD06_00510 [Oscillospiraceae bacterium]|nr:hypothetical protein [Oscillospiraceae bacterium]
MKKILSVALAVLMLAGVFAMPVAACWFRMPESIDDLFGWSNLVVVGTAVDAEARIEIEEWNGMRYARGYMVVFVQVEQVIAGNAQVGDVLQVLHGGYESPDYDVDDWELMSIDPPRDTWLEVGNRYLLFVHVCESSGDATPITPWHGSYFIDDAGNITARPGNNVNICSLAHLNAWWARLPNWLQFTLRWVFFGWLWMCC